jgi:hypothetical protein
MKTLPLYIASALLLCGAAATAQTVTYVNYIRQFQMPEGITWDASDTVADNGSKLSALEINPGGARFELWTMKSSSATGLTEYPLESCYVGTYIPVAQVKIRSQDTSSSIVRTRADRPFYVDITLSGLLNGATDPEPSKSVKFLRHVQSYGVAGTGVGIDRTQATLLSQSSITTNGTQTLTFLARRLPGPRVSNRLPVHPSLAGRRRDDLRHRQQPVDQVHPACGDSRLQRPVSVFHDVCPGLQRKPGARNDRGNRAGVRLGDQRFDSLQPGALADQL